MGSDLIRVNGRDLSGAFLNSAHEGLTPIFLAIVADGLFVVGKSLEVEYGLAP